MIVTPSAAWITTSWIEEVKRLLSAAAGGR
jgi:hypothetical protein